MEGIPALSFWDLVTEVYKSGGGQPHAKRFGSIKCLESDSVAGGNSLLNTLSNIDWVPPSLPPLSGASKLIVFEDNEAVLKMILKGRSPNMRHVVRTHRVDLDWLFERLREDPGIFCRFVGTKEQVADILTKGSFSAVLWQHLLGLLQIGCLLYTSDAADE